MKSVIIGILLATCLAFAQEGDFMEMSLEELLSVKVESASKTAMSSEDAPGIVTVVSRDEIRNYGLSNLSDLLNLVPGFTVGRSFQSGSHNTLYVRGSFSLYSEDVLILKNGQRLNDPLSGGAVTFLPDFPLDTVKQVEIIRGPGSALYGANAFAALINIITDETEVQGTRAEVAFGDPSIAKAFISHTASLLKGSFNINASYAREEQEELRNLDFTQYATANPPPFSIGLPLNRHFDNRVTDDMTESLVLGASWRKGNFSINLDYTRKENANNWGAGVLAEPVSEPTGTIDLLDDRYRHHDETDNYRIGLHYNHAISDHLEWTAQATYGNYAQDAFFGWTNVAHILSTQGEGHLSGFYFERETEALNGDVSLTWQPKDGHVLVAGYGYESDRTPRANNEINQTPYVQGVITGVQDFRPNGDFLDETNRDVNALYAQYTWQAHQKVAFTGGVRADDYSDFGSTVNPRFAMVASPTTWFSLKALYGQAFRAPTALETSYSLAGGIKPNPELKPEEIKTTEVQALFKVSPKMRVNISGFEYKITDAIRQVLTGRTLLETQSQNEGERSGQGLELEAVYQSSATRKLFLNYSKVDPTVTAQVGGESIESEVSGVPKDALNFGMSWDFNKHVVVAMNGVHRWNWTSQPAIPIPDIQVPGYGTVHVNYLEALDIPDVTTLSVNLTWRELFPGANLELNVDNITDEQWHFADQHSFAPGGVTSGGRAIHLGLSWRSNH